MEIIEIELHLFYLIVFNNGGQFMEDEGVFYEITYFPKITPKQISKKQLIQMAESFM